MEKALGLLGDRTSRTFPFYTNWILLRDSGGDQLEINFKFCSSNSSAVIFTNSEGQSLFPLPLRCLRALTSSSPSISNIRIQSEQKINSTGNTLKTHAQFISPDTLLTGSESILDGPYDTKTTWRKKLSKRK